MPLRILKASAGSGKTYSLTESYIRYCLDEKYRLKYSNILAITFTNKASAEMKDRIVGLLFTLSKEPMKYPGIEKLQNDLGMSVEEIQVRCTEILTRILREFDLFTITTIDSFFTRLYGSMTLDLFDDVPREITFDEEKALKFAADQVIAAAREDDELRQVVMDLMEEKIREGEGLGLRTSLVKLGKELFNDEFLRLRQESHYVEPARDFHQALMKAIDIIEVDFQDFKDHLKKLLDQGGMSHDDFNRSFTSSILKRDSLQDLLDLKGFARITDPDQWFTRANHDLMMSKVGPIMSELEDLGQRFYNFVETNVKIHATYSVVLRNYGSYRVLRFLHEAVQDYLQDRRLIFLSDINLKIHEKITDDDSMIVYEKLGQRIKAIMIDEFQDTSQIQWDNLKPLLRNNMAEGYPNLVVGDVKQAIYRFRNGNWEIMEIQVPKFKKRWEEKGAHFVDNLEFNWRSSPEIVSFNNEFFSKVSDSLSDAIIAFKDYFFDAGTKSQHSRSINEVLHLIADAPRKVYNNATQSVPAKNKYQSGFVEVNHWAYDKNTPRDDVTSERMKWLKTVLEELFTDDFVGDDIGILARGKKELAVLSEHLTRWSEGDNRFRFSSEDSLKLDLSDGVQMLIAALKVKAGIDVTVNRMVFSNYRIKLDARTSNDLAWSKSLPSNEKDPGDILESELIRLSGIQQLSLFFESVISATGLAMHQGQWPYLLSFMEQVKKYEMQNGPDVAMFLEEWDIRIRKVQIQMSDDPEKIRLFTIHKSKGLEFDIVLIPFGEWDFEIRGTQDILWVENNQDDILKLAGPLPVFYSTNLLHTAFDYAFMSEYLRNVMDNLNLLYVAMTRPRKRLYIRLQEKERDEKKKKKETDKPVKNTLDLFQMIYPDLLNGSITMGVKNRNVPGSESPDSPQQATLKSYHIRQRNLPLQLKPTFDGSQVESIGRGLIIHSLLEDLKYHHDIHASVSKSILAGDIRENERDDWITLLRGIVDYEPVRDFYQENWNVHNEKSIMVVGGGEYRPDRIQENGEEYVVIDYKTGAPSSGHISQIRRYKSIIEEMVLLPVRSYIYYPMIPELVEVK